MECSNDHNAVAATICVVHDEMQAGTATSRTLSALCCTYRIYHMHVWSRGQRSSAFSTNAAMVGLPIVSRSEHQNLLDVRLALQIIWPNSYTAIPERSNGVQMLHITHVMIFRSTGSLRTPVSWVYVVSVGFYSVMQYEQVIIYKPYTVYIRGYFGTPE